jgi:3'(2'), 5'-bisphosphate nucleotidase
MKTHVPSATALQLLQIAQLAGQRIMAIYATDFSAREKTDHSPVTLADEQAETIILAGLAQFFPKIPVIAEESVAAGRIPEIQDTFFLVDPLDGTKEFLSRNGEFTVNIALIENGAPALGVVYAPAINKIYFGEVAFSAGQTSLEPTDNLANAIWEPLNGKPVPS